MQGKGFVVSASTPSERSREIAKWRGDPWYFTLNNLNIRLTALDPGYTIVQIKEKFGELRFYFRTSNPSKRPIMDEAVRNAERIAWEIDKQKATFDNVAPPAPDFSQKFEW